MAEAVKLPKMSDTMTEGVIVKWNYKVGDSVKSGDVLAEVETDKATMDMEVYAKGSILYLVDEGSTVPVDGVIAVVGTAGEDYQSLLGGAPAAAAPVAEAPATTVAETTAPAVTTTAPAASAPVATSTSIGSDDRLKASPLAKKLAEEKGIDLNQVQGSGENGRIVRRDIETFVPSATAPAAASPAISYVSGTREPDA
jgi:pyruvate dehydrogenase E2 component (dihydrolipoamide acetyltransferase)